jgi:hypothetical protein
MAAGAVAALVALVAAAALVLVGIAVHLAAVVVAFISLLICATGGWYEVPRRAVARVIAVAVVVASVAAFGTGLFFADISVWRVIFIMVLGGVPYWPRGPRSSGLAGTCAPIQRT